MSPRIGISYKLTPVTSLNASAGIFHQNPAYIWLATEESNINLDNIRANHFIAGIDHLFSADIRATVEVYEKQYDNYAVSVDNPTYILVNGGAEYGPNYVTSAVSEGTGTVRGFDVSLQKKLSGNGIYGMLNYSYMNSKFKALEGKTQTELIDYLTLKIVACGFIKEYTVTTKVGFFSYMIPCWVHKMHLMFKCVFNPELVGGLYIVMGAIKL